MAAEKNMGFEIVLDSTRHILSVSTWGFWDVEFMQKYESAFTEKVEKLRASSKEWCAFMDLTGFYACSTEVQSMLCQQITKATKQGLKKLVYLGKRSAAQLQLNRLFLASDIQQYFFTESEEEAFQWLLRE